MKITDDYSLTRTDLIEKGYAELDVYSIRLDRYFTDVEKDENSKAAHTLGLNTDAWTQRCRSVSKHFATINTKIVDLLNEKFAIYQYRDDTGYNEIWDLFFWCNDLYNTTNGKESGRDMSYVTLTFNEKMTKEQRNNVLQQVRFYLEKYEESNIQVIIQYTHKLKHDVINVEAEKTFKAIEGKFVALNGYGTGKIKLLGDGYAFFKKGARRYYYHLQPVDLCEMLCG